MDTASWDGLATGLLSALTRLHAAGVVHRDVKPANILLAADGPRIIDFGVAQLTDATALTATGTAFGTLGWLAPEQIRGLDATPASDTFSAGAVLAYAATGRPPFGDGPPAATLRAVMDDAPDLGGIPEHARTVIEFLLDKDPTSRWTTGQAAEYLAGSGEPTVVDAHATRMWHHGELTQILATNRTAEQPNLPQVNSPSATPAPHGRKWKRWVIGATAAATLAAAGVLGADLVGNMNTKSASTVAAPESSTVEESKDQASGMTQSVTEPVAEQIFSADCVWESKGYDWSPYSAGDSGPWPVTGNCDGVNVDLVLDWQGEVFMDTVSNVTAVGTIDGLPVDLSLTDDGWYAQEDAYERGFTGTFSGTFAGETLVAPWRDTRTLEDAQMPGGFEYKVEKNREKQVGTEGEALIGGEVFKCVGPTFSGQALPGTRSQATTTGTWLPNPRISEKQIAALCGFLADGYGSPEFQDGL